MISLVLILNQMHRVHTPASSLGFVLILSFSERLGFPKLSIIQEKKEPTDDTSKDVYSLLD